MEILTKIKQPEGRKLVELAVVKILFASFVQNNIIRIMLCEYLYECK